MNGLRQDAAKPIPRQRDEDWMSVAEWQRRHRELKARAAQGGVDLLFLGASIIEGWNGPGKEAWDEHIAPFKAAAFGIGGDQTQHLLWRIQDGELDGLQPKAVAIHIGTNNFGHQDDTPEAVLLGLMAVMDQLLARWPKVRPLLLSLLPIGATAADPLRRKARAYNRLLEAEAAARGWASFNSNELFLSPDGSVDLTLLPDGLHPNALGYQIWAKALKARLRLLVNP